MASASGFRAASPAVRSTTSPTAAIGSNSVRRMPSPWISIKPPSPSAGRTSRRPVRISRYARSSATSLANGRSPCPAAVTRFHASVDLPEPEAPRISIALGRRERRRRGWSMHRPPSHCRQPYDEAGAKHAWLLRTPSEGDAILNSDCAAMGFDDLFGDR